MGITIEGSGAYYLNSYSIRHFVRYIYEVGAAR